MKDQGGDDSRGSSVEIEFHSQKIEKKNSFKHDNNRCQTKQPGQAIFCNSSTCQYLTILLLFSQLVTISPICVYNYRHLKLTLAKSSKYNTLYIHKYSNLAEMVREDVSATPICWWLSCVLLNITASITHSHTNTHSYTTRQVSQTSSSIHSTHAYSHTCRQTNHYLHSKEAVKSRHLAVGCLLRT